MRKLASIPVAILGLLLSHTLTYRILSTDNESMHQLLHDTGHSWLGKIPQILVLSALGIFLSIKAQAVTKKYITFKALYLIQSLAFLTIEIGERYFQGINELPTTNIILIGLLLQLPISALLYLLLKVVEPIVARLRSLKKKKIKRYQEPELNVISAPYLAFCKNSYYVNNLAGRGSPLLLK